VRAGEPEACADRGAGLVERGRVAVDQERGVPHEEERVELECQLGGILGGVELAACSR
jgi:hypothetical protein